MRESILEAALTGLTILCLLIIGLGIEVMLKLIWIIWLIGR